MIGYSRLWRTSREMTIREMMMMMLLKALESIPINDEQQDDG